MGIVKKAAGWATGISPAMKVYHGVAGEYDPNQADFQNPYTTPEMKYDQSQRDLFGKDQASDRTNFMRNAGNLSGQGAMLNQEAAGYNPLIDQLTQGSQGQGPSLANLQLQQALGQNVSNQLGVAASNRSVNPALALRMASQNIASLGQGSAMNSAQARIQEQQNALSNLLAARQAQSGATSAAGNVYGNASQLYGNMNNQDTNAQQTYQSMAEMLAEKDRQARMGLNTSAQSAFEAAQKRRGEFVSKLGSAAASL